MKQSEARLIPFPIFNKILTFLYFDPLISIGKCPLLLKEDIMNIEKVIEIKIDNVIYIVSEENKDENYLKEVIKKLLVEKLKDVQKNELYDKI